MQEIAELCMMSIIKHLSASNQRLEMYEKAQSEDPICQQLVRYCQTAWPDMKDLDPSERVNWQFWGEMTIGGGLLLHGQRIVVPKSLHTENYMITKVSFNAALEQNICVVAWPLTTIDSSHQKLPRLCQRLQTEQGAADYKYPSRVPMAIYCCRSLQLERYRVSPCC